MRNTHPSAVSTARLRNPAPSTRPGVTGPSVGKTAWRSASRSCRSISVPRNDGASALWRLEAVEHLPPPRLRAHAEAFQDTGGQPMLFADESEQQMLGAQIGVAQVPRFVGGQGEHPL